VPSGFNNQTDAERKYDEAFNRSQDPSLIQRTYDNVKRVTEPYVKATEDWLHHQAEPHINHPWVQAVTNRYNQTREQMQQDWQRARELYKNGLVPDINNR
jgi:hypothetical protein